MSFDSPSTTTFVAPAEPIDTLQRYLVKVSEIVDLGPSKFPRPNDDPNKPTRRMQWKFRMAHADGTPVFDLDGNPYEHYDYTSSKTGKATREGGKTATARIWMEALFGREIENDEIDQTIIERLIGKVAVALFEEKDTAADGQESNARVRILKLTPYRSTQQAAAEVKAAAGNAAATVQRARTAVVEPGSDLAF